jgi:hypothetical protein
MDYVGVVSSFSDNVEAVDIVIERTSRTWTVSSPGRPGIAGRVRRIDEAQTVARQQLAAIEGADPDTVTVHISQIVVPKYGDIAGQVRELAQLRVAAEALETKAAARTTAFVKQLTGLDIPVRDIGELLDLSPQRVSQLSNAEPTERFDVTMWLERSRWVQPGGLNDKELTAVTGLPIEEAERLAAADEAAVSDHSVRFPQPHSPVPGRRVWPAIQTFTYVFAHLPHRQHTVPRLFPRIPDPAPGVFTESVAASVAGMGDFAVHLWRPGDGGPLVAMAYADRYAHTSDPSRAVVTILDQLDTTVAAVALFSGESTSVTVGPQLTRQEQPCLMVAERPDVQYYPDPLGPLGEQNVSRYEWTDLVNLLRVDLPWWPTHLEELGAMLAWRPWAPLQTIVPQSLYADPRTITGLASVGDPEDVRQALERQAGLCLYRLASAAASADYQVSPGLVLAAVSAVDSRGAEPRLTVEEKCAILHHRTTQQACDAMLRSMGQWDFMPVFTFGIKLNPQTAGRLARTWMSRLVDVPEDRRDEIGFRRLRGYLGEEPVRWMTDPAAPHSWVLQHADGRLFASVGTHTPNAVGTLTSAEIDSDAAFFTDSSGTVWPLPDTGFSYYNTGYEGGGPQRLTETIIKLLRDARDDVHQPAGFDSTLGLYTLFSSKKAPYAVPAKLLEEAKPKTSVAAQTRS